MTEAAPITTIGDFSTLFPKWLTHDNRPGYSGYIIKQDYLLAFAKKLRDEYHYDYLSSVTGVDYYPENLMEVVYHFYRSSGGSGEVFKVQCERDNPVLPSLVEIYPGADFQEREIWDLYGIRFEGHPDLRRILMWEGFAGYPMRKDWTEPYYESEVKPFASRWPSGVAQRSEIKNSFADNVSYPAGFNPDTWDTNEENLIYQKLEEEYQGLGSELKTERMIVNLGPQHPSTHGVFRMVALLEGETIVNLKPVMGYLHRNHEKIGERNTFLQNIPYTDRLDYITSMSNNFSYVLAVEKLMNIQPPERAEYIRVLMAELTRIQNHFVAIGFLLNDLGAFYTPALYGLEERELILDIFEAVSGSRMMCNYMRFGGVARDLPDGIVEKISKLVMDRLPRIMEQFDKYLTQNEILQARCQGVGILTPERGIALSATGPLLRSAGVPYDIRRAEPYSIYDRFEFDVAFGIHGDVYDRYLVRIEEIYQSMRIIQQVLRDIPDGPIQTGKSQYQPKVPAGEAYARVEGPKGELGFYIISNGKANPWRYHIRSSSFINLTCLTEITINSKIADAVIILGSVDITLGEVDR